MMRYQSAFLITCFVLWVIFIEIFPDKGIGEGHYLSCESSCL